VTVSASLVGPNPVDKLPPADSYTPDTRVAELVSLPYSDFAKLILNVSYNIGADTSLVPFGLTQGVDNLDDALVVERQVLTTHFGIDMGDFLRRENHAPEAKDGGVRLTETGVLRSWRLGAEFALECTVAHQKDFRA